MKPFMKASLGMATTLLLDGFSIVAVESKKHGEKATYRPPRVNNRQARNLSFQ